MSSDKTSSIAEAIYADLVGRILSDALPAGTRLASERELAAHYGTNRNTLREAIRKLEQARLVRVRHGQGVTVCDFRRAGTVESLGPFLLHGHSAAERVRMLVDLLMTRARVLEMAVELAARRAEPADIARLEEIAARQLENFTAADNLALLHTDLELINAIIDAGHSLTVRWFANTLLEIYSGFIEHYPSVWVYNDGFPEYLRELTGGIASRQVERAVGALRRYYQAVDGQLIEVLNALAPQDPPQGGATATAAAPRSATATTAAAEPASAESAP